MQIAKNLIFLQSCNRDIFHLFQKFLHDIVLLSLIIYLILECRRKLNE